MAFKVSIMNEVWSHSCRPVVDNRLEPPNQNDNGPQKISLQVYVADSQVDYPSVILWP